MNTDGNDLKHYEITRSVIGSFYQVYKELGHGFLEAVYVEALSLVLRAEGLAVCREMPIKVYFRGNMIGRFRADAVVNGKVLVEVKALPRLEPMHGAQILNYLRATALEVGLLLNFGRRPQFRRLRFDNAFKTSQRNRPCQPEPHV
ncbi:MAG TPA: GxxExxY protein [Gemmatimonadales bacterium]|jgi:GxxExxY protein